MFWFLINIYLFQTLFLSFCKAQVQHCVINILIKLQECEPTVLWSFVVNPLFLFHHYLTLYHFSRWHLKWWSCWRNIITTNKSDTAAPFIHLPWEASVAPPHHCHCHSPVIWLAGSSPQMLNCMTWNAGLRKAGREQGFVWDADCMCKQYLKKKKKFILQSCK